MGTTEQALATRQRIAQSDPAGYAALARALAARAECARCVRLRERGIAQHCGTYGTECAGERDSR